MVHYIKKMDGYVLVKLMDIPVKEFLGLKKVCLNMEKEFGIEKI